VDLTRIDGINTAAARIILTEGVLDLSSVLVRELDGVCCRFRKLCPE